MLLDSQQKIPAPTFVLWSGQAQRGRARNEETLPPKRTPGSSKIFKETSMLLDSHQNISTHPALPLAADQLYPQLAGTAAQLQVLARVDAHLLDTDIITPSLPGGPHLAPGVWQVPGTQLAAPRHQALGHQEAEGGSGHHVAGAAAGNTE